MIKGTKAAAQSPGVIVALADQLSADGMVVVAVSIPNRAGDLGFGFDLPSSVRELLNTGKLVQARQLNGDALPSWLSFDAQSLRFNASAAPAGAIPIEVLLTSGDRRVRIVISERQG